MIILYRVANCDLCDEVQDGLRELVVAHKVVAVEKERVASAVQVGGAAGDFAEHPAEYPAPVAESLAQGAMPVVADGDRVISGAVALRDFMAELADEMEQWRKFQTDACYIDDKGKTC
jgi:hypothetical protein